MEVAEPREDVASEVVEMLFAPLERVGTGAVENDELEVGSGEGEGVNDVAAGAVEAMLVSLEMELLVGLAEAVDIAAGDVEGISAGLEVDASVDVDAEDCKKLLDGAELEGEP